MNENQDYILLLNSLGLTENESRLYLAILELGDTTLSFASTKAGIKRTTAYVIARDLEEKGLLSHYEKRGKQTYSSISIRSLVKKTKDRLQRIEDVAPELEALERHAKKKAVVKYYEGHAGYMAVLEDTIAEPGITILNIGAVGGRWQNKDHPKFMEDYISRRVKQGIRRKSITFPEDKESGFIHGNDPKILREVRFLPQEYFYSSSIVIYRNKVAFFSSHPNVTVVVIESEDIALAETKKFEFMWKNALEFGDPKLKIATL